MASHDELLRLLRDVHDRQKNVGLSAAIVAGGKTVLAEGLGFADLEHQVPVTRETRFGLASITKAFTGVAFLKLREEGKIELDVPIQRYVPSFPVKPGRPITPRLLAAHLAGLRHWNTERTPALYAKHFNNIMDILPLFQDDSLVRPVATGYSYSSYGYNLLGAAMQSVSATPYQEIVRTRVLDPLKLANTGYDDVRRVQPHRARRYSFFDPWTFATDSVTLFRVPDWDYSHNMAGGNMYSTAEDLAVFGRALMKPGVLNRESLSLLYTKPRIDTVTSTMSFGFYVVESAPGTKRRLNIGGSNAGVQTAVYVWPDDDLVVVVLSNTWGVGSQSGEMTLALPARLGKACLGG